MTGFRTPNFRGRKALVMHRPDDGTARLVRQLERLGMDADVCWPDFPDGGEYSDVIFFDADSGFDGLFPWPSGEAPMPLVALLGSELPGRIEWAINQSFCAHVIKPVRSNGIFSALVIAFSNFEAQRQNQRRLLELVSRLDGRRAVIRAVVSLMKIGDLDEDAAFSRIRSAAMTRRTTVEDFCSSLDETLIRKLAGNGSASRQGLAGK